MTTTIPTDLIVTRTRGGAAARRALLPVEALECAARVGPVAQSGYRASRLAAKRAVERLVRGGDGTRVAIPRRRAALVPCGAGLAPIPVSLSLSHSGDRAVAAVGSARLSVGVDLERRGAVPPAVERFFLSRREQDALAFVDATHLWCMKEAAWKALDAGSSLPLHELELRFERGTLTGVRVGARAYCAGGAWFEPWRGWIGAVVWRERRR
jgi:phosphopantetheinyl transferase